MAERRNSYTTAFKLRVINSAESSDKSKAARKYKIDVSMVRRWRLPKKTNWPPQQELADRLEANSASSLFLNKNLKNGSWTRYVHDTTLCHDAIEIPEISAPGRNWKLCSFPALVWRVFETRSASVAVPHKTRITATSWTGPQGINLPSPHNPTQETQRLRFGSHRKHGRDSAYVRSSWESDCG